MQITTPWALSQAQTAIEVVATVAFALSGVIEGARKRLDAVGICVVAGLSAFGGGTLRDILLDRRPLFWVQHANWIWALLALCALAMLFMRARHLEPTERAMQWPDALGLGLFTAGGTQIALDAAMPGVIAVMLGMVTAVFGGVLRDIVCNEIPRAFSDHRPYAVCSFAGGWVMVGLSQVAAPAWVALLGAALTATALRALAVLLDWRLPAWQVAPTDSGRRAKSGRERPDR
ncbi:trimeric intracellular cation channel family protein [Leptothrix discophora]|uniref:Trimeric intracellular cation channel family protein n=1 Tax=Leptothrix discophora TaxID=89 RepID=A0ABT9FZP0_LEPDI|nr:trimeric intracellular cation channel family protein [Leptothrix discophora]MDP4299697.1 trimeric intracellular cation channel family protein [Leptothrix discophora]